MATLTYSGKLTGDNTHYCPRLNMWLIVDGKRWCYDVGEQCPDCGGDSLSLHDAPIHGHSLHLRCNNCGAECPVREG